MPTIVCEHDSSELVGSSKHNWISKRGSSVFLGRDDIMPKASQVFDRRKWKILVRVKKHPISLHESFFAFFISANRIIDFFGMFGCVIPRRL
jgi:hypothetical protein